MEAAIKALGIILSRLLTQKNEAIKQTLFSIHESQEGSSGGGQELQKSGPELEGWERGGTAMRAPGSPQRQQENDDGFAVHS